MSVWANAGGKPQLTYAERLRRATQGNSGNATSSGQLPSNAPNSTLSPSSRVTSAPSANRPKLVSDNDLSGSASSRPGASGSSAPHRQTLVTSSLTTTSSDAVAPQRPGGTSLAPTSSAASHTSSRPGLTARPSGALTASEPQASASTFASPTLHTQHLSHSAAGAVLSPNTITASSASAAASVNGDDAASTTHSVHTTDSSSQSAVTAPSTSSTTPTSVATNNTMASASRSGLTGLSSSSSVASSSNAAQAHKASLSSTSTGGTGTGPASPPVNVWEARKTVMMEKQRIAAEEARRRAAAAATAASQQQATQQPSTKPKPAPSIASSSSTADAKRASSIEQTQQQKSKTEGGSARRSQGNSQNASSGVNAPAGGERKNINISSAQQPKQGNASSGKGSGKQNRTQQGGASQVATGGLNAGAQAASTGGEPALTAEMRRKDRTASHSGSVTSSAAVKEDIGAEADNTQKGGFSQRLGDEDHDRMGSKGQADGGVKPSSRNEDSSVAKKASTSETTKEASEEPSGAQTKSSRTTKDDANSEVVSDGSGLDGEASKDRSSSSGAAARTGSPSTSSKDAFSSALNGAAAPFFSPMMGPHQTTQHLHGNNSYGDTNHPHHRYHSQHYHHDAEHHRSPRHHHDFKHHERDGYGLVELGSVPPAPLPPSLTSGTEDTTTHSSRRREDSTSVDPLSSASALDSVLRSPSLAAAPEYDNTWLERIHMLNGGQNMPVYGPLTLASTRKSAEDQEKRMRADDRTKSDAEQEYSSIATQALFHKASDVGTSGPAGEVEGAARFTKGISAPSEDLANLPVEIETAAKGLGRDRSPTTAISQTGSSQHLNSDNHSRSSPSPQQQHQQLYPESRSRARRRSSTGHKGRKAGALAALASGPGGASGSRKGSASGPGVAEGAHDDSASQDGAVDPPPLEDTQSWPSPLDAKSAKEHDRAVQARERATSAAATQAAAMAAAVSSTDATSSHKASNPAWSAPPLPNGKAVVAASNASGAGDGIPSAAKAGGKLNAGVKKAKNVTGQNASVASTNVSTTTPSKVADEDSKQSASSTTPATANAHIETSPAAADDLASSNGAGPAAKKSSVPAKPLDTRVTRALANEGTTSGSSLSPRPAHLPATPPPSLVMPPLTSASGSINGSIRGASIGGGSQGRGAHSRTANGTSATGSQHGYGSYDSAPNGLAIGSMVYPYQVGPMATAPMWNGTPSSPHPYHRPHRINKDGSFSPTRAVDYTGGGGGPYYGGESSTGSGYGGRGGMGGGKRGRGRGSWRGGSSGSSSSRHREYPSTGHHHGGVVSSEVGPMQHVGNFDPRFGPVPQMPQVYYVPYPVPVPYVASAPRTESSEASYTAVEGTTSATANSEQASDAGAASSSAAPTETGTPSLQPATATGYIHWQPGMTLTYPYYGMQFTNPASGMMPSDPVRAQALSQLDFYFSPRNLEGDFFLRQRMDSHGWVPIPVVAAFKKVRQITADVNVIRDAMMYSENLEVDMENWRVRKRYGWEEYVLPAEQQVAIPHTSAPVPSSGAQHAESEGRSPATSSTEQATAVV
ncbi:hypothetical protein OC846_002688 [Tilletia horrida]|uniref:HTH La-type RNA-binding domain-containing protein n=1 Tax=Tilletia horrida TaxID=155126 RepID=A0AAN6GTX0_9BASI|nr:hypothetical protein OC846_002688 [Tilletia horrida]KAK0566253.1 hypothetical protein OC861_003332 [Tilletia horrida]